MVKRLRDKQLVLYIPVHQIKCHKSKTNMKGCIILLIFAFPFISSYTIENFSGRVDGKAPVLKCFQCNSEEKPSKERTTQTQEKSLKCYKCSSEIGENCTADFPDGNEVNCHNDGACMITVMENIGQEDIIARDCVPEISDSDLKCDSVFEGTTKISLCNCRDELCNENWTTAGSTTSQNHKGTSEAGQNCGMSFFGEEIECPWRKCEYDRVFSETGEHVPPMTISFR